MRLLTSDVLDAIVSEVLPQLHDLVFGTSRIIQSNGPRDDADSAPTNVLRLPSVLPTRDGAPETKWPRPASPHYRRGKAFRSARLSPTPGANRGRMQPPLAPM